MHIENKEHKFSGMTTKTTNSTEMNLPGMAGAYQNSSTRRGLSLQRT
jgi:hypothetical protein